MVHPALLNADLVFIICEPLDQQSLSALARTARFLQDPALRKLWRDIKKFSHLFSLLGSSMRRATGRICFSNALTSLKWDRFRFYAQYVRSLCISSTDEFELSTLLILFPRQPLLPCLKTLIIYRPWSDQGFFTLSMFFVASIQKFTIHSCQDLFALESLITTLGTTAPALQDLTISVSSTGPCDLGKSISVFHNLYSIDIPVTDLLVHSVLSHLSTLPSLSRIQFSITGLAREPGNGLKYAFPAVRELCIKSRSDGLATYLMALTRFDKLTNLTIICDDFQDADPVFNAISVSCGRSLNQIKIIGLILYDEPVKFPSLYPLFKFTNLRSFTFRRNETLWPTDDEIQDIAKSWPNLEEFCVYPYFDDDDPPSPLTLTGLLLLIERCTNLMEITIAVNATDVPNVGSSFSRPGLTIEILPWSSPFTCVNSLAEFLSLALPDADIKLVEGSENKNWEDVIYHRRAAISYQGPAGSEEPCSPS